MLVNLIGDILVVDLGGIGAAIGGLMGCFVVFFAGAWIWQFISDWFKK